MPQGGLRDLVLACAACGLIAAGGIATIRIEKASAGRRAAPVGAPRPLPDLAPLPPPSPAPTAAGTFLGMPDEALLERLRSAPIRRIRLNRGGSSLSLRLQFADGSKAAFKPRQVHAHSVPRKEIAAYRINRELGLNGVPPAAARVITRDELIARLDPRDRPELPRILAEARFEADRRLAGEASYWIPVIRDADLEEREQIERWSRWVGDGAIDAEARGHATQISAMVVFDFLINNADRFSGANTLGDERLERLFFMDNTMSFGPEPEGHKNALAALLRVQRFSRRLLDAARALSEGTIRRALATEPDPPFPLLLDEEIRGVLHRRDFLIRHVDRLAATHGAGEVICFE
jgi:hypothetical protein